MNDRIEPEATVGDPPPASPWSATEVFGGLSVLAVVLTLCLLVLHWAGIA
jgi:hypothetical protein